MRINLIYFDSLLFILANSVLVKHAKFTQYFNGVLNNANLNLDNTGYNMIDLMSNNFHLNKQSSSTEISF